VQGDSLKVDFVINQRQDVHAILKDIRLENFDSAFTLSLPVNQNFTINKTLEIPDDKKISQPYWLEYPLQGGTFEVRDQMMIGKAQNDPAFEASILVNIAGEDFNIRRPVQYRVIDPVKGDLYEPIPVLPKAELSYERENYLSVHNQQVTVVNHFRPVLNYGIEYASPDSFNTSSMNFDLAQKFSNKWRLKEPPISHHEEYVYSTFIPRSDELNVSEEITAVAKAGNKIYDGYIKTISYDHIPTITYFPKAKANLVKLDLKIIGKKIGYIAGAGDKVSQALEQMGYEVKSLSETDINDENLKQFDAIITGIRAYNIYAYLSDKNDILMRYVKNGGNIIVQYLKSNQVGQQKVKAGPYPFTIDPGSRVTEEDATVNFLLPAHPALNYPNKITEKDFEGWVQERSTYQAVQMDSHYESLLSMHDTGQQESKGSLLIAKYGRGNFVYAGLVFFRQLPAVVPGAYRLMANLIALPKNK